MVHELVVGVAPDAFASSPSASNPALAGVEPAARRQHARRRTDTERARAERQSQAFLATLAHELRTPLQSIRFARTVLGPGSEPRSRAELGALAVIDRELDHLLRLVGDLLDVARVTHGKLVLRLSPLSLETVVADAVHSMRLFADVAGVRLDVEFDADPRPVVGDADRLAQVFANLLHNAVKYSVRGGVVEIRVRPAGKRHVAVSVRDHGAGIAQALLGSVFELFAQDEDVHAPRHGGLGIGLSLVRSLVALHGGSVSVRSEGPGTGSEFLVTLPRAPSANPVEAAGR